MTSKRKNQAPAKTLQGLKPGDIVDVVAPGFGVTKETLENARQYLIKQGFVPRIPKDILEDHPLHANSDEKRAKLLIQAIKAKDSKVIWFLRGGYGSNRLLSFLRKIPKQKPKMVIGLSDITSLHGFFMQKWKWPVALHASLLDRLGNGRVPEDVEQELLQVVRGEISNVQFENLEPLNKPAQKKSKVLASITGGNLKVVEGHIGTPEEFSFKGKIAFFEEIGERGYRVDRMLWHLSESGAFKDVKAVVFGSFTGGEEPQENPEAPKVSKVNWVLKNWASIQKFPVLIGIPSGHDTVQRVLPLGTKSILTTGATGQISVETGVTPS